MTAQISYRAGRWSATHAYEIKDALKAAAWRFDGGSKAWTTTDPALARMGIEAVGRVATVSPEAVEACSPERTAAAKAAREAEAKAAVEASKAAAPVAGGAEIPVPAGCQLYPFQVAGAQITVTRDSTLIADEMGLGKTIQAIAALNVTKPGTVLIVAPLAVKTNWMTEWEAWSTLGLSVGAATTQKWPDTDVVVIHPAALVKQASNLQSKVWDAAIVDEAHLFRSPTAAMTKALYGSRGMPGVQAKQKIALTGTPVVNRPKEMYPTLNFLQPRQWGRKYDFEKAYCGGHKERFGWVADGGSNTAELAKRLRSEVMVRRRKADVLTELPEKTHQVLVLDPRDLSADVRAALKAEQALAEKVLPAGRPFAEQVVGLTPRTPGFEDMARARADLALAKAPHVADYVASELDGSESKVVVWAHHTEVIELLAEKLEPYGAVTYYGATSQPAREAAVKRFQGDDACRVFVGGITAAGVGITLTAASHVVFAELDWTPGNMSQAEDRCHRIGQRFSVLVQMPVVDGSLDARMAQVIAAKGRTAGRVLDDLAASA
ncbi:MAG: DEAD/DEAH box helicase [Actinomycetota bacterium]|nr:DEAD/DEAH box helicase [Actinomycetota bacterium]